MNRIRNILVPIDFSPCAENALRYVNQMACSDDTLSLLLLHVQESEKVAAKEIEQQLTMLREQLYPRLQSRTEFLIETGPLLETILNIQQSHQVSLIVMGTQGADQEGDSRTSSLVLQADCPVLVIPDKVTTLRIDQIALALDENEVDDPETLGVLHDVARCFGADVHVLTINPRKEGAIPASHRDTSNLEYYLESLDHHYAFPENTDIEQGIADYIEQHRIDMLAILPRNHARKTQPSEGRLTQLLALHTKIPLLAID